MNYSATEKLIYKCLIDHLPKRFLYDNGEQLVNDIMTVVKDQHQKHLQKQTLSPGNIVSFANEDVANGRSLWEKFVVTEIRDNQVKLLASDLKTTFWEKVCNIVDVTWIGGD